MCLEHKGDEHFYHANCMASARRKLMHLMPKILWNTSYNGCSFKINPNAKLRLAEAAAAVTIAVVDFSKKIKTRTKLWLYWHVKLAGETLASNEKLCK